jgi:hypothetical protein
LAPATAAALAEVAAVSAAATAKALTTIFSVTVGRKAPLTRIRTADAMCMTISVREAPRRGDAATGTNGDRGR